MGRVTTLVGPLAPEYDSSVETSFALREPFGRSVITGPTALLLAPRGTLEPGATFSGVWLTALATAEFPVVDVTAGSAGSLESDESEA
jgi:hypothetical protein